MAQSHLNPMPTPTDYPQDAPRLNLGIRPALLMILLLATISLFLISLAIGSVSIPLDQVITVLAGGEAERGSWTSIIMKFRLPKAITASLAGAALGVGGLMMQTFFRNPLAEPSLLGVSSGASLGVALVVLSAGTVGGALIAGFGLAGDMLLTVASALGSGFALFIVLMIAGRFQHSMTLLIVGLMMGYLISSAVSLLLYFSIPERIQIYINWSFGNFSEVTWSQMPIFIPTLAAGLVIALMLSKSLNALLLGEGYARSLGLNIYRARFGIICSVALLTGTVTAFCGPISFIGITVPHLCRSLFNTSDHRILTPGTILMGAIVAMTASLIADLPGHNLVLPVNAITAIIGAPVILIVILRQHNLHKSFAA